MNELGKPREVREGVFQIKLSTPYPIGPVYVYLIKKDPITLIDVGVNDPHSTTTLKNQLATLGITPKDVERILLTHGHSDHYGAAQTLRDEGAKSIFIHPKDMDKVTNRADYYLGMKPYLAKLGTPPDYLDCFVKFIAWETPYAQDIGEVSLLKEGDTFSWGTFTLEIMETPGHSPGHVVFLEISQGWAITGDFLFAHFTPDPIIDVSPNRKRTPSMILQMESLKRFSSREAHDYFPGHREEKGARSHQGVKDPYGAQKETLSGASQKTHHPLCPHEGDLPGEAKGRSLCPSIRNHGPS
jgi:glyoxylase-like metal-dependent hydrolase (beta-lactamase superfamily II)